MLRVRIGRVDLSFSFWFFGVVALFALLEQGGLAMYLLLPIMVHELGHLLVMALCGVRVRGIRFQMRGVNIRRDAGHTLGYGRELAVCLAGAVANLLLALLLHLLCFHSMRLMMMVASNLAVAIFNLAPIGDLDGGQAVKLLTSRFWGLEVSGIVSRGASFLMLGVLFGIAIFLLLQGWYNLTLLVACGYLAFQVIVRE